MTAGLPHRALTTSVLRRQTRAYAYATRAGIAVAPLGSHVFRHNTGSRIALAPADCLQRFDVAQIFGSVCESFELDQILDRGDANPRGRQRNDLTPLVQQIKVDRNLRSTS